MSNRRLRLGMSLIIIHFNTFRVDGYDICKINICKIGLTKEFNFTILIPNSEVSYSLHFFLWHPCYLNNTRWCVISKFWSFWKSILVTEFLNNWSSWFFWLFWSWVLERWLFWTSTIIMILSVLVNNWDFSWCYNTSFL